jgi:hypothetical protein
MEERTLSIRGLRSAFDPKETLALTSTPSKETLVEFGSPAGNGKWSKQLWATQGSFAEVDHIRLQLL